MPWWLVIVAVWLALSFGSVGVLSVAAEVRGARERRRIARDAAAFEALVATLETEPRSVA